MSTGPLGTSPVEPRKVDSARGGSWLAEGFDLFKRQPRGWIGIVVVYLLLMLAASLIPGADILMSLAAPAFTAGIMLGCSSQAGGQGLKVAQLFEGFRGGRLGQLVQLALIYFGACLVLVIIGGVLALTVFGISPSDFSAGVISSEDVLSVMLLILVMLALYVPIAMGMWLSPALIVLRGVTGLEAFKLSFRGCLVNMGPFLRYGVIALAIAAVASILPLLGWLAGAPLVFIVPLSAGWLVAAPVFFISVYTAYRDIFPQLEPPQQPRLFV